MDGPADYAMCDDGRVIGGVEAKKLTIGPEGVLAQAERYSRGIRQQPRYQGEYKVPFLYSTNGERIRFHDVRRELNPVALGSSVCSVGNQSVSPRDRTESLVGPCRETRPPVARAISGRLTRRFGSAEW